MRPAAWQSWGLADGKVVLGGSPDDAVFAGGDGSETAPFLIRTEAQLRAFAATTADGETYAGQYVALDADITLNGDWTPIPFLRRYVQRSGPHGLRHDHRLAVRPGRRLGFAARLL